MVSNEVITSGMLDLLQVRTGRKLPDLKGQSNTVNADAYVQIQMLRSHSPK